MSIKLASSGLSFPSQCTFFLRDANLWYSEILTEVLFSAPSEGGGGPAPGGAGDDS